MNVVLILAIWCAISIPVAVFVGRRLHRADRQIRRNIEDVRRRERSRR